MALEPVGYFTNAEKCLRIGLKVKSGMALNHRKELLVGAPKTYVPSANMIANKLHEYLTRYQEKLVNDKTAGQIAALAALIECLATFIEEWPKPGLDN